MMHEPEDQGIRNAFQAARDDERRTVPAFRQVLSGRSRQAPAWMPVLGWLAGGSAVAFLLLILLSPRAGPSAAELGLARSVVTPPSATDFLLDFPGAELLTGMPRLDRAVAGSPLTALDPGGPLDPSALSRSLQ
jgi:hypothetical protein